MQSYKKRNLRQRLHFIKGEFKENYNVTIGLEVGFKEIKKNDKIYKLQIWDTAGQEKYRSVTRGFYKNSVCGFVVYDITKKDTFKRVIPWIEECKSNSSKQITIILLGNKTMKKTKTKKTKKKKKKKK